MSGKIQYWTPEKVERLRENCNEPWSKLLKMFPGKTKKSLRHVMTGSNIRRDRDKAPNKTKITRKWTPEKVEELRQHRQDNWLELEERFLCSQSRLETVMSTYKITRDRPESILWNDQTDRILIEAVLESNKHNTRTGEGRRKLRNILKELDMRS